MDEKNSSQPSPKSDAVDFLSEKTSSPVNKPSCSYTRRSQLLTESTCTKSSGSDFESAGPQPEKSSSSELNTTNLVVGPKWSHYMLESHDMNRAEVTKWSDIELDSRDLEMLIFTTNKLSLRNSGLTPSEFQTIDSKSDDSSRKGETSTLKPIESSKREEVSNSECSDSTNDCFHSLHSEPYESSANGSESLHSESFESSTNGSESLHSESFESSTNGSESLHSESFESSRNGLESLHSESSSNGTESLHSESFESSNSDSGLQNQELSECLKRKSEEPVSKSCESSRGDAELLDSKLEESVSKSISSDSTSSDAESQESASNNSGLLDSTYTAGPFSENYTHLKRVCTGTFGCISKGYRNSDGLLVFTKFIRKSSIFNDVMVYDDKLKKKVPIEVSLLQRMDHPNIIKVLDVFENDLYFHLVMEKHGIGMDLFTFINRNTCRDEPLICHIFRQIVDALSFLHYNWVLHRDIKDENCVIDENFHVKLIDFGSAAIMSEEPFTNFYGTKQYCSPEVIKGEKYLGPELEMFALGVTLYTLAFGELPFKNKKEILKGEFEFPKDASEDLDILITGLLEPVPDHRLKLPEVEINKWVNQDVQIERYSFAAAINATEEELHPSKYLTITDLNDISVADNGVCFLQSLANLAFKYNNWQAEAWFDPWFFPIRSAQTTE